VEYHHHLVFGDTNAEAERKTIAEFYGWWDHPSVENVQQWDGKRHDGPEWEGINRDRFSWYFEQAHAPLDPVARAMGCYRDPDKLYP
jgi:hypothetical protein